MVSLLDQMNLITHWTKARAVFLFFQAPLKVAILSLPHVSQDELTASLHSDLCESGSLSGSVLSHAA